MIKIKVNRIDTNGVTGDKFCLVLMGDWHLGAKECDVGQIKKDVEWIKNQKDCKVVLMGDLLNCGMKDSVGAGSFDDTINPQEQIDLIIDILEPIKHKVLGIHIGNHCRRIYDRTSINIIKNLCNQLDVSYFGHSVLHHLRFKKQTYTLYTTHGNSGSTTPQGKLGMVLKLGEIINSDLIACGHVHDLLSYSQEYMTINLKDKTLENKERFYVITGHYLEYGGYAENKNYAPGKIGCAKVYFDGNKHDIDIKF